jgi:hypothetical protein
MLDRFIWIPRGLTHSFYRKTFHLKTLYPNHLPHSLNPRDVSIKITFLGLACLLFCFFFLILIFIKEELIIILNIYFEFMSQFSIIYVLIIQRAIRQNYIHIILDGEHKIIIFCYLHILHSVKLFSTKVGLFCDISVSMVTVPVFLLPFQLLSALYPIVL